MKCLSVDDKQQSTNQSYKKDVEPGIWVRCGFLGIERMWISRNSQRFTSLCDIQQSALSWKSLYLLQALVYRTSYEMDKDIWNWHRSSQNGRWAFLMCAWLMCTVWITLNEIVWQLHMSFVVHFFNLNVVFKLKTITFAFSLTFIHEHHAIEGPQFV